jgi:putative FmdB family regulatory protein
MPFYEYACSSCDKHFDELRTIAKRNAPATCKCGAVAPRVEVTSFNPEIWQPITLEHIADKPMRFESKKDLTRYCRDHQLESGALL